MELVFESRISNLGHGTDRALKTSDVMPRLCCLLRCPSGIDFSRQFRFPRKTGRATLTIEGQPA